VAVLAASSLLSAALPAPALAEGTTLKVLTFNVWHGRRQPEKEEGNRVFPGEDAERADRRFDFQIEEIKRLDPDLLLFQEVNPNQRQARRYAAALGYDEVHKVTSCGLHLGKLVKIPKNVNEGMAILARPELGLRRAGKKRLSGNAKCTATWGFQTRESRYVLFGEIRVAGQPVLVANVHAYSPAFMPPGFLDDLDGLVDEGTVSAEQRQKIVDVLDSKLDRHVGDMRKLLREIDKRRQRLGRGGASVPVVLGGDFNAEPTGEGIALILGAGFASVTADGGFATWDPVTNKVNFETGTKLSQPVPTFGIQEIEDLLAPRRTLTRQIDHIFYSPELASEPGERVLDQDLDGMFPSDHFGVMATLRLP
jgi:endonuclease/exonuclease/phosphatase family metal-dependent hydrolase